MTNHLRVRAPFPLENGIFSLDSTCAFGYFNMHMCMYILELLGGYRQYGKVRDDARGGRARDCVRLRMRIGTAGLSFSLLFVLVCG